jgi:hypothetical protein
MKRMRMRRVPWSLAVVFLVACSSGQGGSAGSPGSGGAGLGTGATGGGQGQSASGGWASGGSGQGDAGNGGIGASGSGGRDSTGGGSPSGSGGSAASGPGGGASGADGGAGGGTAGAVAGRGGGSTVGGAPAQGGGAGAGVGGGAAGSGGAAGVGGGVAGGGGGGGAGVTPSPSVGCGKSGRPGGGMVMVANDHLYTFPRELRRQDPDAVAAGLSRQRQPQYPAPQLDQRNRSRDRLHPRLSEERGGGLGHRHRWAPGHDHLQRSARQLLHRHGTRVRDRSQLRGSDGGPDALCGGRGEAVQGGGTRRGVQVLRQGHPSSGHVHPGSEGCGAGQFQRDRRGQRVLEQQHVWGDDARPTPWRPATARSTTSR